MLEPAFPTDDDLRALTDAGSFKRAQRYVSSDVIEITSRSHAQIDAIVSGSEEYSVRLLLGPQLAASRCTCPAFSKGLFCKHLIATAIVARESADTVLAVEPHDISSTEKTPQITLREFLEGQPSSRLAGWLADLADTEPSIERRLRLYQLQRSPVELKKALSGLLRARRFLDWRASRQFARELDLVVDLLSQSSTDTDGLALYEYALSRLFKVYGNSDDSGGDLGQRVRQVAEQYVDDGPITFSAVRAVRSSCVPIGSHGYEHSERRLCQAGGFDSLVCRTPFRGWSMGGSSRYDPKQWLWIWRYLYHRSFVEDWQQTIAGRCRRNRVTRSDATPVCIGQHLQQRRIDRPDDDVGFTGAFTGRLRI